jgi:hypothetical protein
MIGVTVSSRKRPSLGALASWLVKGAPSSKRAASSRQRSVRNAEVIGGIISDVRQIDRCPQ